jgi:manganese transport protein
MNKIMGLTLGILTSMGGFIDISNLVFATQAGAIFGLNLLWPLWIGAVIVTLYAEMSGRVAIVARKAVFDIIEIKLGYTLSLCVLIASNINNLMICAAEVGGVAYVLRLLFGLPFGFGIVGGVLLLMVVAAIFRFDVIEKLFGLGGLLMLIFLAATFALPTDWGSVAQNLIPHVPQLSGRELILYLYFAVGLVATGIMPYEVYFYSSGMIEEKKTTQDLSENTITSIFGFGFGTILSFALIILAALQFLPRNITPHLVGTAAMEVVPVYGKIGLWACLVGMFFAMGGAAIETCFAGAYTTLQFLKKPWGKEKHPREVPHFTAAWIIIFVLALMVLALGVDPVQLTSYAVIFSVLVLPFTYLPILLVSADEKILGKYKNKPFQNVLGWIFFVFIILVALSAIPLLIMTNGGQG